jgi:hypothetical protein
LVTGLKTGVMPFGMEMHLLLTFLLNRTVLQP